MIRVLFLIFNPKVIVKLGLRALSSGQLSGVYFDLRCLGQKGKSLGVGDLGGSTILKFLLGHPFLTSWCL